MSRTIAGDGRTCRIAAGLTWLLVLTSGASVLAQELKIEGHCQVPKVKGRSGNNVLLNEWNIWLSKDGTGWTGQSWRTARMGWPAGYYRFPPAGKPEVPAGNYSLYLDEPIFWGRPTVVSMVEIPASGSRWLDVELPTDYSCRFAGGTNDWGPEPVWTSWSDVWYQTFIAQGTSVTGVTTWLAGTHAGDLRFSILEDNGGNITSWPEVGAQTRRGAGFNTDLWVRFRSGEAPTTPGHRYALKYTGVNGSPDNTFAVYRRNDEDGDGQGYANGRAYDKYGNPQGYDLDAVILADNDGTVVPYCVVRYEDGTLAGSAGTWGQEVRAVGNALAGVTIYFASPDWQSITATFTIKSSAPNGDPLGPAKSSWAASMAADAAFFSASWNPGEVVLPRGQKYYIEVATPGFNPFKFTKSDNIDNSLRAYKSGGIQPEGVNVFMQVVEYANVPPPTICRSPTSFTRTTIITENLPSDHFDIWNCGGGLLSYTITDDVPWLGVTTETGTSFGETDSIEIIYDTTDLSPGLHTGTITISAPGATNTPQYVPVDLTVLPHGPCDFEPADGDVDMEDFGHLQECLTGTGAGIPEPDPGLDCTDADLDRDEDVDQNDVAIFRGCLTGAGVAGSPPCTR